MTGLMVRLRRLTLDFLINQLLNSKVQILMDLPDSKVQLNHLHNHLLEVRNNGWIMPRILATGEKTKWRLPTLESHIGPLFRPSLRDQIFMDLPVLKVQLNLPHSHS